MCYINSLWRWQGCSADSHLESTIITLLEGKSCHSHCIGHPQSWLVYFGLGGPLHKNCKLFLTPSHVTNEAKVCCRDYFQKQRRYWLCNWHRPSAGTGNDFLSRARAGTRTSPYWHSLSKIDLVPIWGQVLIEVETSG